MSKKFLIVCGSPYAGAELQGGLRRHADAMPSDAAKAEAFELDRGL